MEITTLLPIDEEETVETAIIPSAFNWFTLLQQQHTNRFISAPTIESSINDEINLHDSSSSFFIENVYNNYYNNYRQYLPLGAAAAVINDDDYDSSAMRRHMMQPLVITSTKTIFTGSLSLSASFATCLSAPQFPVICNPI